MKESMTVTVSNALPWRLIAIFLAVFACPVTADILDDAIAAYKKRDYATALRIYEPLAKQGNARAQFNLAYMYGRGEGAPKDMTKAIFWFRKAAGQGLHKAQYNLGRIYQDGEGVAPDHAVAADWFEKAAVQGDVRAQEDLAVVYIEGLGRKPNLEKAIFWLEKAAAQGSEFARTQLEQLEKLQKSKTTPN